MVLGVEQLRDTNKFFLKLFGYFHTSCANRAQLATVWSTRDTCTVCGHPTMSNYFTMNPYKIVGVAVIARAGVHMYCLWPPHYYTLGVHVYCLWPPHYNTLGVHVYCGLVLFVCITLVLFMCTT